MLTDYIDSLSKLGSSAGDVISSLRPQPKAADIVIDANRSAATSAAVSQTNWTPWIIGGAALVAVLVLFGVLRK